MFLLSARVIPLSPPGGRSWSASCWCEHAGGRVPSPHGSAEQAKRRPRLGGLDREQSRGEAEGEVGSDGWRGAADQGGCRRARHARRAGLVLAAPPGRLRRELIFALCEKFFAADFSDFAKSANFRFGTPCMRSGQPYRLPLAPSTERK